MPHSDEYMTYLKSIPENVMERVNKADIRLDRVDNGLQELVGAAVIQEHERLTMRNRFIETLPSEVRVAMRELERLSADYKP